LKNFFLRVAKRKKGRKFEYRRATSKRSTRFAVEFFLSYESLKSGKRRIFCQQATYKGKYGKAKEAIESARAGLLPQKRGREKVKKKKRKEQDQGRQEGGSSEGKVPCALNQDFLFLVHKYLGLEAAHLD
jgi:hypothetical protein